jgi:hypothetical protein
VRRGETVGEMLSTVKRGEAGLPRVSVAGLVLAFMLAAALATAVGVAAWSLGQREMLTPDALAHIRTAAYADGLRAGVAQGRKAGLRAGHRAGYRDGVRAGLASGRRFGFRRGHRVGYESGRSDGFSAGFVAGKSAAGKRRAPAPRGR